MKKIKLNPKVVILLLNNFKNLSDYIVRFKFKKEMLQIIALKI